MRFDDRVTGDATLFAKQARIIHIEIDPAEIEKIKKTEAPVVGDAKEALKLLTPLVKSAPGWVTRTRRPLAGRVLPGCGAGL